MLEQTKTNEDYPVSILRDNSIWGDEVLYGFPETEARAVVAQDVFGEKEAHMQLLIYPSSADSNNCEVEEAIAIRFNNDGTVAEIIIPPSLEASVFPWDYKPITPWLKARDGEA